MSTMKLSELVTPNPCNPAMEQRNWDGVRTALQKLDEIIVINVDEITNEITYDLHNINDITVDNDLFVTNDVTIGGDTDITGDLNVTNVTVDNNLTVTNDVTIGGDLIVTGTATFSVIYATTVNTTYLTATYVDAYTVDTTNIIACHYYDCDGNELCPPPCGTGGAGDCCGVDMTSIETLNVTVTGAVSGTGTLNYITPPGGGACRDYTGTVILDADDDCGNEIMELTISLSCPYGGTSAAEIQVTCSGGGGSCAVSGGVQTDPSGTESPFEVNVDFTTQEISGGGCPCGTGQTISLQITE